MYQTEETFNIYLISVDNNVFTTGNSASSQGFSNKFKSDVQTNIKNLM